MLTLALVVAAASVSILLVIKSPNLLVYASIVLAFTAVPAVVPRTFALGPAWGFLYELTLVGSAILVLRRHPPTRGGDIRALAIVGVFVGALAIGVATGSELRRGTIDARGLVILALAVLVAARLYGTPAAATALKVYRATLWVSLSFLIVASVTGLPLSGRTEDASLVLKGAGALTQDLSGSERYLTPATHAALACLCVCVAGLILGRMRGRDVWTYAAPALAIVFLSFSRNSILVLGVAAIATVALGGAARFGGRAMAILAGAAVLLGTVTLAASGSSGGPGAYVSREINSYAGRVVDGLSGDTLSRDGSAQFRIEESRYLWADIEESPFTGHGFGHAFRPVAGPYASYLAQTGAYYAHNFYLWLWNKAGLWGLAVWLWVLLPTIFRRSLIPASATLAGFGVGSLVAPFPNGQELGSAMVIGILIGATWGAERVREAHSPEEQSIRDTSLIRTKVAPSSCTGP